MLLAPGPGDEGHDGALHGQLCGGVSDGVDVGEEFDGQISKTPWVGGVLETLDDFLADGWADEGKEGEGGDGGCCGGWGGVVDLSKVAGSAAAAWSKSARVQLRVANTTAASMGVVRGTSVGLVRGPRQSRWGLPRNVAAAAASGGVVVRPYPTTSLDWWAIRSMSGPAPCGLPWSLRAWFILHRRVGRWVGAVP